MDGGASIRSVCACVPAPLCTLVHPHVGVYTCMRGHRYPCVCMCVRLVCACLCIVYTRASTHTYGHT